MAARYTDVDLMLLKRWDEVDALRSAFDALIGRMSGVIESSLQRVANELREKGFESDWDLKRPDFSFWKREWENKRKESTIYLNIGGFAPFEYGKNVEDHPTVWLCTEEFGKLRTVESSEEFGKLLRNSLSEDQRAAWSHDDLELDSRPLGREYADVDDLKRVSIVSDPEQLTRFLLARVDDCAPLVPVVDAALARLTRK